MFSVWDSSGRRVIGPVVAVEAVRAAEPVSTHLPPRETSRSNPWLRPAALPPLRRRRVYASELMSEPVITLDPEATLDEAAALFEDRRFRHVPVLDERRRIIGVLSDRDLLRASRGDDRENLRVADLMATHVLTAAPDTLLREIARLLLLHRIGCMPIVEETTLVGIITRSDLLRALVTEAPVDLSI